MKSILLMAVLVACGLGCTKTQANQVVDVGGVVCEITVHVANLPDLCATAEEFARAVIALTSLPAAKMGGTATAADIRTEILRQRSLKAPR